MMSINICYDILGSNFVALQNPLVILVIDEDESYAFFIKIIPYIRYYYRCTKYFKRKEATYLTFDVSRMPK